MNSKLTAKQMKELFSLHKKLSPRQSPISSATMRLMTPDEVAQDPSGIVTHYTIKRPRAKGSSTD